MAVSAYILIETSPGTAGQVAKKLREFPFVKTASAVTGPYDVICMVEAPNLSDVGLNVVNRIQGVEGVLRTLTCLNVDH